MSKKPAKLLAIAVAAVFALAFLVFAAWSMGSIWSWWWENGNYVIETWGEPRMSPEELQRILSETPRPLGE